MRHGKVEMVLSTSAPVRLVVQGHSRRSPQVTRSKGPTKRCYLSLEAMPRPESKMTYQLT
ncbi:MAG: hypothetical protein EBU88_12410 [Acidobacteria bacterium]|nr:hypothetical protein [Acidobacteriota bacterium]